MVKIYLSYIYSDTKFKSQCQLLEHGLIENWEVLHENANNIQKLKTIIVLLDNNIAEKWAQRHVDLIYFPINSFQQPGYPFLVVLPMLPFLIREEMGNYLLLFSKVSWLATTSSIQLIVYMIHLPILSLLVTVFSLWTGLSFRRFYFCSSYH